MATLTEQQIESLKFSYEMSLRTWGLRNPCHEFWNDGEEEGRDAADILRNRLEVLIRYATGCMALCEVSHILNEVAEEFEEEVA